eukprot:jgi/Chlat1/6578/Chrsp45S06037
MLLQYRPKAAGRLLAERPEAVRGFFRAEDVMTADAPPNSTLQQQRRVTLFFQHFSMNGDFRHGARALSRYALKHRDRCWGELVWEGAHAQSPVMVAAKPHYFLELDIVRLNNTDACQHYLSPLMAHMRQVRTVRNFLARVPEFWESAELREEILTGDIIALDYDYFVAEFDRWLAAADDVEEDDFYLRRAYERRFEELVRELEDYLAEESLQSLCTQLFPFLSPKDTLRVLQGLVPHNESRSAAVDTALFGRNAPKEDLQEITFLCAISKQGRQVAKLLQEDEYEELRAEVKQAAQTLASCSAAEDEAGHWHVRRQYARALKDKRTEPRVDVLRHLFAEGWLLRWRLYQLQREGLEEVMRGSGIEYQLQGSEHKELTKDRKRRRKERKSKKRKNRARYRDSSSSDDSDGRKEAGEFAGWKLQSDGFAYTWSPSELPDYLADHALSCWLASTPR